MIQVDFKLIDSILEKYECQKTKVIPIMQDIQKEYKFLPSFTASQPSMRTSP